jgi:hypothetical protein
MGNESELPVTNFSGQVWSSWPLPAQRIVRRSELLLTGVGTKLGTVAKRVFSFANSRFGCVRTRLAYRAGKLANAARRV